MTTEKDTAGVGPAPVKRTTPNQQARNDRIVWVDCEMTGLEPDRHVLVEIAAIVTDADLTPLDEGIDIVIHATDEELGQMDDYVTTMHSTSGLTEEIRRSPVTRREAEEQVLAYLKQHIDVAGMAPLAGNSIGTDRMFIRAQMPELDNFLHYRMIDVSSVKELARRWHPAIYAGQPAKGMAHRALADIIESIRELDYYRHAFITHTAPETATLETMAKESIQRYPMGEE